MDKKLKKSLGNFLNIIMLFDKMQERGIPVSLVSENDQTCLSGMQIYFGQAELSDKYIYVATKEEFAEHPFLLESGFFVVVGEVDKKTVPFGCSYIVVSETENVLNVANQIQQIFVEYQMLEKRLYEILNCDGNLYDICVLALEHFKNPVFIHDEYFNILACPQFIEGSTNFTYNEQAGKYTQDVDTLNNFRTSQAYKNTLLTTGGQLWESDFDDTRSIYVNIWMDENYKGRFVIGEAISRFKPGQLFEAEYFAEIIKQTLLRRYVKKEEEMNPLQNFIMDAVNGVKIDSGLLEKKLLCLGWNQKDRYVCGLISFENEEVTQLSIYVICNDIEEHVPGSYTCYFKNAIYVIVNLSIGNLVLNELRMSMSYIIREGLLNMGVSNEFREFDQFPLHICQAEAALKYAKKRELTSWYNEFSNYVLEYWMTQGLGEFTKETISSSAISLLQSYDQEHGTELFLTLKTYLIYERNATLTARILKIHRSTLPHRLERIMTLTGLNLDNFRTRLYLLMSFTILEEGAKI